MIRAQLARERDRRTANWRRAHARLFHDEVEAQLTASLQPRITIELSPLDVLAVGLEDELTRDFTEVVQDTLEALRIPTDREELRDYYGITPDEA